MVLCALATSGAGVAAMPRPRARAAASLGSRLAGSRERLTDDRLRHVERLAAFAESRRHTMLELALSWLASQQEVTTVIAGATSAEQVRANTAAVEAWRLTDEELASVDQLLR